MRAKIQGHLQETKQNVTQQRPLFGSGTQAPCSGGAGVLRRIVFRRLLCMSDMSVPIVGRKSVLGWIYGQAMDYKVVNQLNDRR